MNFLDLWLLGTIPNFGKFLAVIEIFLLHSLFFFSPSGIPILHHLKFSQSSWIFFFLLHFNREVSVYLSSSSLVLSSAVSFTDEPIRGILCCFVSSPLPRPPTAFPFDYFRVFFSLLTLPISFCILFTFTIRLLNIMLNSLTTPTPMSYLNLILCLRLFLWVFLFCFAFFSMLVILVEN